MPVFNVPISGPNGSGSGTIQVNASDAGAAAQNATQGGNTVAGAPQQIGGGGAPASSPSSPSQAYPGVNPGDLASIQAGFAASSGFSIKQLNETIREFDANLDWQKQMWQQQGLPQLAIQQRAQDLAEKTEGDQVTQAQRQQAFVEEQGRRQSALAEKTQADANAIAQGQLGLDTLKTAATLTGPQDWIKAANFSRGVAQTNLPAFMTDLLTGRSTGALGGPAPGATMSDPNTLGSLAAGMGAGATAGTPAAPGTAAAAGAPLGTTTPGASNVDAAKANLAKIYAGGGQALGPQQLEGLTGTEMQMFQGGGADLGADVQGFMDAYKRSRIGQTSATPSVAMATGGIVTRPTVALIGEAGPEAVVPLGDRDYPFRSQTTVPPPPMDFPNMVQVPSSEVPMQFDTADQVIAAANRMGLQGNDRSQFIMRYFNPYRGQALRAPVRPPQAPVVPTTQ